MIIIMEPTATEENIKKVDERLVSLGFRTNISGESMTVIGAIGNKQLIDPKSLQAMDGVKEVVSIQEPYKLGGRTFHPNDSIVEFSNGVRVGEGLKPVIMAGPCSIEEDTTLLMRVAKSVKGAGADFLRGGAFKPRTSPYDFQGLAEDGLKQLADCREETGLLVVTEVMDSADVDLVANYADMLQIGARNMQNFKLLTACGQQDKPVLLKRGLSGTIREWLLAAEYILHQGNMNVVLCERGIRSFDAAYTRNVLDISAVPVCKRMTHLPIICDPSHAGGRRYLINPLSKASIAAGAHGLMIEVHPNPDKALSDGQQSLTLEEFDIFSKEIQPFLDYAQTGNLATAR